MDKKDILKHFVKTMNINVFLEENGTVLYLNDEYSSSDNKVMLKEEDIKNIFSYFKKFDKKECVYFINYYEKVYAILLNEEDFKLLFCPIKIKDKVNNNFEINNFPLFNNIKIKEYGLYETIRLLTFLVSTLIDKQISNGEIFSFNFSDPETQNKYASVTDIRIIKNIVNNENINYYEIITNITDMVNHGNTLVVLDVYHQIVEIINGIVDLEPFETIRIIIGSLLALVNRSAIKGGVHFEIGFQLGKTYIDQLSKTVTVDGLYKITYQFLSQFTDLVHKFQSAGTLNTENNDLYYVTHAKRYITQNINKTISVLEIAANLKITPNYLSSLFKKSTGQTINKYISTSKISIAKKMINYTDTSLADIAFMLGYSSQSHFCKKFKEETGLTPKEYLNNRYIDKDNQFKIIEKKKK